MGNLTYQLDNDEKKIINAFDSGEFKKNGSPGERNTFWKKAIKETTKKKPVNLRLQEQDIQKLNSPPSKDGGFKED